MNGCFWFRYKYLKNAGHHIAFAEYIWILASKAILKPYLKHDIVWEKFFPEKHIVGRTFKIHLLSLGWKWGLAALKKRALSKFFSEELLLVKKFDAYKI